LRPLIERATGEGGRGGALPEVVTATAITWRLKSITNAPVLMDYGDKMRVVKLQHEVRGKRHDGGGGFFWIEDMPMPDA
jgi:hypothetical protein